MALTAELEPSSARLEHPALWETRVVLRNDGDRPVRVSTVALAGPVSFELVDDAGRRVSLGPPPVPPADLGEQIETIPPGEALTLVYHGDELLPDSPAPGRYGLRFVGRFPDVDGTWSGRIESPWVQVEVPA